MILKKIYNNNIVLCIDENGEDVILVGLGIAFHKKVGQPIDESKIERKFVLDSEEVTTKYNNLLQNIPIQYLDLTNQIVNTAQKRLKTMFHDEIYIAICDHINCAFHRYEEKKPLKNALLWEIKKYYQKEYEAALESLKLIEREEAIKLDEDEAGFIALHFVNGQINHMEMNDTITQVKMMEDIMKFVSYHLNYHVDEKDINYQRFLTHIRFLLQRVFSGKQEKSTDEALFSLVKQDYKAEYECAKTIAKYIEKTHHDVLLNNEIMYLSLHLHRMISREN